MWETQYNIPVHMRDILENTQYNMPLHMEEDPGNIIRHACLHGEHLGNIIQHAGSHEEPLGNIILVHIGEHLENSLVCLDFIIQNKHKRSTYNSKNIGPPTLEKKWFSSIQIISEVCL